MITSTSRDAWRELESRLRPFVARRVPSAADVDDVIQDVFVRMLRGLSGLRDDERFGPWVYQVARSAIADHRRACARHPMVSTPTLEGNGGSSPAVDGLQGAMTSADSVNASEIDDGDDGAAQMLAASLTSFVAALPAPYREALTLTELEGHTQREAAGRLGISVSGMKSRVQRGRAHLRQALEECCAIAIDVRGHVTACEPHGGDDNDRDCCAPADVGAPCAPRR